MQFKIKDESQVYTLGFDFNALADAEAVTKHNLLAAIGAWPALGAGAARALLYALLKPAHPEVLVEEAGGLFTKDLGATWEAMKAALKEASLLVEDEDEEKKAPGMDGVAEPPKE
jgi:hypothetical protein